MKKVLLASTALLLTAGFASAQSIELSGSANAGLKYEEGAADEVTVHHEVNMVFTGSGVSDTGLEFGAYINLDEGGIDSAEVFISGLFGTVSVGSVDPATDGFGIADIGFDGIGVDDPAEQYKNATGGADIHYSYSAAGLTFSASAQIEGDEAYAAAIEYAAQGFSGGIGYITAEDDGGVGTNATWTVAAGYSQGPISINGVYSDWDGGTSAGGEGYGVDVSFDTGAATIIAAYSNASGTSAGGIIGNAYGIGASVPLGGGLTLAGGVGIIDEDGVDSRTVADLGLTMSF